jgi:hypothetical protein
MAEKKPLCTYAGVMKELQSGDILPVKNYNGFVDRVATLSMDGAKLTITGNHTIYSNGVRYDKTTAQIECTFTGENFVYYNTSGVLSVANSAWDILSDNIPIAIVYKTIAGRFYINEERHSYNRDRAWHKWAHDTIGARYEYGYNLTSTPGALATFSISQGEIHDEDINYDTGGAKTACRLWFRDSGGSYMETIATASNYLAYITGGNLQYDNGSGVTDAGNNKYVVNHVYATMDASNPIACVIGQADYNTVSLARNAPLPTFNGLATREWKLLYKTIWQNSGGGTYVEQTDYRTVSSLPNGATTAQAASSVTFNPSGNIAATNVQSALEEVDSEKQAVLVSGTTIKTVNSTTLLGSGDVAVQAVLQSGTNIKTINGSSILGSGDLTVTGGSGMDAEKLTVRNLYGGM